MLPLSTNMQIYPYLGPHFRFGYGTSMLNLLIQVRDMRSTRKTLPPWLNQHRLRSVSTHLLSLLTQLRVLSPSLTLILVMKTYPTFRCRHTYPTISYPPNLEDHLLLVLGHQPSTQLPQPVNQATNHLLAIRCFHSGLLTMIPIRMLRQEEVPVQHQPREQRISHRYL